MKSAERKQFIAEFDAASPKNTSGKNLSASILEATNVIKADPPVMTGPGVELINGVPPIDWRFYFPQ